MHWGVFAISAAHLYQNYLEETSGLGKYNVPGLINPCTVYPPH